MPVSSRVTLILVLTLLCSAVPTVPTFASSVPSIITQSFDHPIDGFSVRLPSDGSGVRYRTFVDGQWSPWTSYENDGDSAPGEESELMMVPRGTKKLTIEGALTAHDIHPITVSHEPLHRRIASATMIGSSTIISRSEWGADSDLLYDGSSTNETATDANRGDNGVVASSQTDQRVKDCQTAQSAFPEEFKVDRTVSKDANGKAYRWPIQYSKSIKLLVVHHTAIQVTGDTRSSFERVRALYKYHAQNKGWGDIGYNFIIDDEGRVYEGRQGGKYVVGGHAYCNNIGSIGIVLLGNFEVEQPTQAQAKAFQHLTADLADTYSIDLSRSVQFHGKKLSSPLIGHRDVLSTSCPGSTLYAGLSQIRTNILERRLDAVVVFPAVPGGVSSSSRPSGVVQQANLPRIAEGIGYIGRTSIALNPGGKQRLSFSYTAGRGGAYEGKKVADVRLSDPRIKLWVDDGVDQIPVRTGILLPYDLPAEETLTFQLIVQAPMDTGLFWMEIGGLRFDLSAFGRRARSGNFINPFTGNPALVVRTPEPKKSTQIESKIRPQSRQSSSSSSRSRTSSAPPQLTSPTTSTSQSPAPPSSSDTIRIRLSIDPAPSIAFVDAGMMSDQSVNPGTTYSIVLKNNLCTVNERGVTVMSDSVIRFRSLRSDMISVQGVSGFNRTYRGVIECRVVDGALALINELSLEDYMAGLAEEPDTEPYEKQRAFAIAARTYAAFYMKPENRKFPGKPYDGSDSPAVFQSYVGTTFTANNPEWLRAVRSSAGQVMTYQGSLIKPPYFSSDDGRTRSPSEAGWNNFPASEILQSKDDPWCKGLPLRGHGVGMSGCGALGQAKEGKSAEQILQYYYPGATVEKRKG